ncbi:MAG: DUF3040 domain-containing protein [Actinomycetota bacterium]
MPLSEREQQILAEIEKSLYADDPGFARDVTRRAPAADQRRTFKLGAAVFGVGFALLLAFFVVQVLVVGIAAFAAMVGGIVVMAGAVRALARGVAARRGHQPKERLAQLLQHWEQRLRDRYKQG